MAPRLRIGLTGGIASGKSTAAQRFQELGIPVIDADESARLVVTPGSAGLAAIVRHFGSSILTEAGELDRRALRNIAFAKPGHRLELETILHPLIRADMQHRAEAAVGPYLVLAIPLLIEGGNRAGVDRILVIDVDERVQRERLLARDGGTAQQADAVLAAQASRDQRLKAADDVLRNTGSVSDLRHGVDQLHHRYAALAEALSAGKAS